jgi:hypothetical protein
MVQSSFTGRERPAAHVKAELIGSDKTRIPRVSVARSNRGSSMKAVSAAETDTAHGPETG